MKGMARGMDPTLDLLFISENRDQSLWELSVRRGLLISGPDHHDEIAKGEELLKILPSLNLHKRIPSQNEKEGILTPLPEIPDRIDRIRFSRP
jgi:hypothetical protein